MSSGHWVLLLYSSGCDACDHALRAFEDLAADIQPRKGAPRVALIRIGSEKAAINKHTFSPCVWGVLAGKPTAPVPLAFLLSDGRVTHLISNTRDTSWLGELWQ